MDFRKKIILGRTGLLAGRLGLAASYGAPAEAFEEAFEKGCNYFYWGSFRKDTMCRAIKNICTKGKRDELIIVVQSYSRSPYLMEVFYKKALKSLGLDHADILLLGCHNKRPAQKLIDKAIQMKEKGFYSFLGMSGHNRLLFPQVAKEGIFDLFHVRYNAVHRGAEKEIFVPLQYDSRPGIVSYTATSWGQLLNKKDIPPDSHIPAASECYRFALSNPGVDVCMCGPRDLSQMREALKTLELGPLNNEEMERIKKIGDYIHK